MGDAARGPGASAMRCDMDSTCTPPTPRVCGRRRAPHENTARKRGHAITGNVTQIGWVHWQWCARRGVSGVRCVRCVTAVNPAASRAPCSSSPDGTRRCGSGERRAPTSFARPLLALGVCVGSEDGAGKGLEGAGRRSLFEKGQSGFLQVKRDVNEMLTQALSTERVRTDASPPAHGSGRRRGFSSGKHPEINGLCGFRVREVPRWFVVCRLVQQARFHTHILAAEVDRGARRRAGVPWPVPWPRCVSQHHTSSRHRDRRPPCPPCPPPRGHH